MTFEHALNARMVRTEHGWTPEPSLDPTWPDIVKLRWHASLIRHETGLNIQVDKAEYFIGGIPQPRHYSINMRYGNTSSSSGPHTYAAAWSYLNGINAGAQAVQKS